MERTIPITIMRRPRREGHLRVRIQDRSISYSVCAGEEELWSFTVPEIHNYANQVILDYQKLMVAVRLLSRKSQLREQFDSLPGSSLFFLPHSADDGRSHFQVLVRLSEKPGSKELRTEFLVQLSYAGTSCAVPPYSKSTFWVDMKAFSEMTFLIVRALRRDLGQDTNGAWKPPPRRRKPSG